MGTVALLIAFVFALGAISASARGATTTVGLTLTETAASTEEASDDTSPVDDARLVEELRAAEAGGAYGPVPDYKRRFQVIRTKRAPVIDGNLDDAAWKNAVPLTDFLISQSHNDRALPRRATDQAEARVLFDSRGIYVGVKAYQDPGTIYTSMEKNGLMRPDLDWEYGTEPWANTGCDEIEIVIDPELTMCSYYVFQVNPDGVMRKLFMPTARVYDGLYKRIDPVAVADDAWRSAVTRDEKGWSAEVFIPFESIGFRPMRSVGEEQVYFNMVQPRTVMGFNVNRISHEKDEPSSWSASRGSMFFTDAENFGRAIFREMPAAIDGVATGDVFSGETSLILDVLSRSTNDQDILATLEITGGDYRFTTEKAVYLAAGKKESVELRFEATPPGRFRMDARILGGGGYLIDRTTHLFETPAPVEVVALKSILFEGETDFPVKVGVNLPAGSVDGLRFRVLSGKKVLAEERASAAAGETVFPFEVTGLAKGEYRFEAVVMSGAKATATGGADFRVIEDPYLLKISGTAGTGTASTAPKGFKALAEGDDRGGRDAFLPHTPGYLDDAVKEKGYLWYAVTATDDFYRASGLRGGGGSIAPPRKAEFDTPIRAFAAGGEYEAVSFAVLALDELKNPRMKVSQLRSGGGATISTAKMDLRAERPDRYLVKQGTLGDIPARSARRYMLTVYVGKGTPAGLYEGTLTFSADGRPSEKRDWQLLVLPFALAESRITAGIYGGLRGGDRDQAACADLLAHGMDNFTCFGVFARGVTGGGRVQHVIWGVTKPSREGWMGDDPQKFDAALNEDVFRSLKKTGLRGPLVLDVNHYLRYQPCTEENAELFGELLKEIEALREKHDLPEFVYHLVDEPNNHYTYDDGRYGRRYGIQRVHFFGQVLRKLGLRQYVTVNSTQRGYDIAEKAADECDIWCPNYIGDEKLIDRWSAPGKEIWLYNYAGDGRSKGAMRSTYGFYAPRVKATGVTIWHHPSFVRWVEKEGKFLDSTPWEAGREGIDDGRYIATLEKAIEKAKASGGRMARLADQAEADLAAIINAYPATTDMKVLYERNHDADQWNKWRWVVASWVLRLRGF